MQNKTKQENKKNSAMLIIILVVIFGLLSGMAGGLAGRSFFDFYYLPLFGEINFSDMDYKGSNLIIRDAKKVIVEQDVKIIEAINSAKSSTVGIFEKSPPGLSSAKNDINLIWMIIISQISWPAKGWLSLATAGL
ncbi:hypothetical protein L6248_02275 [Candidatus Parcubacteria bacterium]|nr:hypothetical protein [Candidatus Parcubacteria bacterium]